MFNKILRRVWHLPSMSHTSIVHCVSRIESILKRSLSFYKRARSSSSSLVRYILYDSSALLYTVTGLNRECGYLYTKTYSDTVYFSDAISRYRYLYSALSPFEDYVRYISTS